ncbi:hypothetical protein U0070_004588 [Myodes glareolus]|uniref:Uncharacterized protein n=1 Tax=Myodes glareolus TaxID=447135 RepID=A0AAW0ICT3_MYOGA
MNGGSATRASRLLGSQSIDLKTHPDFSREPLPNGEKFLCTDSSGLLRISHKSTVKPTRGQGDLQLCLRSVVLNKVQGPFDAPEGCSPFGIMSSWASSRLHYLYWKCPTAEQWTSESLQLGM